MVGTAEYMSPEQWRGGSVGPAADVYSLGCVLFEALTGIAPFARKEADTEPEMPEGLDAVIERAVAEGPGRALPERRGADRRRPRAPGRRPGGDAGALGSGAAPGRAGRGRASARPCRSAGYGDAAGRGAARGCRAAGRSPSAPPAWR